MTDNQIHTQKIGEGLPGARGCRKWRMRFSGYKVSIMQDEKVLEVGCTNLCL